MRRRKSIMIVGPSIVTIMIVYKARMRRIIYGRTKLSIFWGCSTSSYKYFRNQATPNIQQTYNKYPSEPVLYFDIISRVQRICSCLIHGLFFSLCSPYLFSSIHSTLYRVPLWVKYLCVLHSFCGAFIHSS